jgi:hypothetical protein
MKKWRCLLALPLLILLISSTSYAEKNLDPGASSAGAPFVAVNKDGVVLAVWLRDTNADNNAGKIFYNVFKEGNWSGAKNAGITLIQGWTPQVDVDSRGNFHVTYPDGASRLGREIYHCVYNPDSGWDRPEMIWNSPENSAWAKIDLHDNDIITIIWQHEHADPYTGHDINIQSKHIDEQAWPGLYERISYTAYNLSCHPAFKVRNERVYVCYMEGTPLSLPWRILYKEADRGSNWINVPAVQIEGNGYYPELAVDDIGGVHVVWSGKAGNVMCRQKVEGQWKKTEVISSKYSALQHVNLQYKNTLLVATWAQNDSEGGRSIHYARKMLNGKWETPVRVAKGSNAYACKIWLDNNGYAHFVWDDNRRVYYEKISMPIPEPFIQLSTNSLSFVVEGKNPDPETVVLKNPGEKSLDYTINVDKDWLSVSPPSGKLNKGEEEGLEIIIDAYGLDEGSHTGTIEVSSQQAINSPQYINVALEVLAPPIYPPQNFMGEVLENMALFYREYMHHLTWEHNPQNRDIDLYKLYESDGVNYILLAELPSSATEYIRRHIQKNKEYNYELWAVDDKGRTGNEPAELTISGSTLNKNKSKHSNSLKDVR